MTENEHLRVNRLRDLVADHVDKNWDQWSRAHPNMARVLERTRLVDSAAKRLTRDEQFIQAMREADLDEERLIAAARVLDYVQRWLQRAVLL